jgi:uncharacterized protein YkuJ
VQEQAYASLVAEEVKKRATKTQIEYLSLDYQKWQRALLKLVENLNDQIKRIQEESDAATERYSAMGKDGMILLVESQSTYDDRRKKIERFLFHVEHRLDEITRIIALGEDASDERIKTVEFLRRAIEKHRELSAEADYLPNAFDLALWATLEGKWLFDEIDMVSA